MLVVFELYQLVRLLTLFLKIIAYERSVSQWVIVSNLHPNQILLQGLTVKYFTLPETNIAPENRPLEKESPIGNTDF